MWLVLEEALEREQPPRDPLRVVEPIDAEENPLAAGVGAYLRRLGEHSRILGELPERLRVDADREDPELDLAAVEEDAVPGRRDARGFEGPTTRSDCDR